MTEVFEAVTTMNEIRAKLPPLELWVKLLKMLDTTQAYDARLPLLTVLECSGLSNALWVLDNTYCSARLSRHFRAWCAEQVLPIFEAARPGDNRPRRAIEMTRDDSATISQQMNARAAAVDSLIGIHSGSAAASAVLAAAMYASSVVAVHARAAAWPEWEAAKTAQTAQLRKMLGGAA